MTANATTADMERTRACGMNDHIAKPLLEAPLWQTLSRWLARSASALPAHHAAGTVPPHQPRNPARPAQKPLQRRHQYSTWRCCRICRSPSPRHGCCR